MNENCDLKICDFGLSRMKIDEIDQAKGLTRYVVTRWYRAPELLLRLSDYGAGVDVWSTGCIMAELYKRSPLFVGHDCKQKTKKFEKQSSYYFPLSSQFTQSFQTEPPLLDDRDAESPFRPHQTPQKSTF